MFRFEYLGQAASGYVEELYEQYLKNPESVDPSWSYFFDGVDFGLESVAGETTDSTSSAFELKVVALILAYREKGAFLANLSPLVTRRTTEFNVKDTLSLEEFGLSQAELDQPSIAGNLLGLGTSTLAQIVAHLKNTYCGTLSAEFSHITNNEEKNWLQTRFEKKGAASVFSTQQKKKFFNELLVSETLERFLHKFYVGKKRFSIEGGESMIPALNHYIEKAANLGATHFVLGMAHRGRLNTLVNLFKKPVAHLFSEFEDNYKIDPAKGESDVKYHLGYSHDETLPSGQTVSLNLAYNPSHLEFVNAVVLGMARAKQERLKDDSRSRVLPILIHGDSAVAGQGVVYETLSAAQLKGYTVGGTLHLVVNNQVGFTTDPRDTRSSVFCTDVAKTIGAPVFHVNGDDTEAVCQAIEICAEYRARFKKDTFINLVCYRKYGHNEGDEPSFTQPLVYKEIAKHASPREVYGEKLIKEGVFTAEEQASLVDAEMNRLLDERKIAQKENFAPKGWDFKGVWKNYHHAYEEEFLKPITTSVSVATLRTLSEKLAKFPDGFKVHSKLVPLLEGRKNSIAAGEKIDWATGETLAYATLLEEGTLVRITGQDVERGTFTHRHAVLSDFETASKYTPLSHISPTQAKFDIHNSHLSETGVMGIEFGFASSLPQALVIWEAQFGDFANGAQVIIDQFLATSETKWQRSNGLVLLLPHGYEGQGPEHSSARLERFLQLSGHANWSVCNFTTPANLFHALRRQVKWDFRKPLVVMTPKSGLRHPLAVSKITEFTEENFKPVIGDSEITDGTKAKKVKRVIICTGKVYYDLHAERLKEKNENIAILRLEQLYPFPKAILSKELEPFLSTAKEIVWVQEEPKNMGAWVYVHGIWSGGLDDFGKETKTSIRYIGRDIGCAPAVGSLRRHESEQKDLISRALKTE